jgi:hypothetical protein
MWLLSRAGGRTNKCACGGLLSLPWPDKVVAVGCSVTAVDGREEQPLVNPSIPVKFMVLSSIFFVDSHQERGLGRH